MRDSRPCPACGQPVEQRHDVGRPRRFCDDRCRARFHREKPIADASAEIERLLAALRAVNALQPDD